MDAGLFGYYPLVDRSKGTYMQIVTMKFPASKAAYFAPTIASMALRLITKGFVDHALLGEGEERGETGGGSTMDQVPRPDAGSPSLPLPACNLRCICVCTYAGMHFAHVDIITITVTQLFTALSVLISTG